jgi:hypothetical protein
LEYLINNKFSGDINENKSVCNKFNFKNETNKKLFFPNKEEYHINENLNNINNKLRMGSYTKDYKINNLNNLNINSNSKLKDFKLNKNNSSSKGIIKDKRTFNIKKKEITDNSIYKPLEFPKIDKTAKNVDKTTYFNEILDFNTYHSDSDLKDIDNNYDFFTNKNIFIDHQITRNYLNDDTDKYNNVIKS